MSTLTIRLPATKHQRLKDFARARGVSLNKLVEEWATVALAQLDAENHYRLRARAVDQRWAWRCSTSSTARTDGGRRERKPGASTDQSAGAGGRPHGNLFGKSPVRIVAGVIGPVAFFETESLFWPAAVAHRMCRRRDRLRPISVRTADGGDSGGHSIRLG